MGGGEGGSSARSLCSGSKTFKELAKAQYNLSFMTFLYNKIMYRNQVFTTD